MDASVVTLNTVFGLIPCLLLAACAHRGEPVSCDFSDVEIEQIRANARSLLRQELGEDFVYYNTDDSVSDLIQNSNTACGVYISPNGVAADGGTLVHGDGLVRFDPRTLKPIEIAYFRW